MTGNPEFRAAVINMAEWGQISLTGPRTVLAVIKKSVSYVKQLRGVDTVNRPLFHQYCPPATYVCAVAKSGFSTNPARTWPPLSPGKAAPRRMYP